MANVNVSTTVSNITVSSDDVVFNVSTTNSIFTVGEVVGIVPINTVQELGNISGNLSINVAAGVIVKGVLTGDITDIIFSNFLAGQTMQFVLTQDTFGNNALDTSVGFVDWQFTGNFINIDPAANATSAITVIYDGTNYNASVVRFDGSNPLENIDTDLLPEGNTNLYFTDARANTAIDTRVNTAFVNALSVDYNSLANAPTAVSAFTNDAGYLVAANLASLTANVDSVNGQTGVVVLTANVDSVNGQTGVVVLDTGDVTEGTNLYYSNARVNAFIQDNITTTDISEGTNLYYTDARANTAIDTRVDKAFVDGLGVDYDSLANAPTAVSAFTNDAGYLVSANLASLTANVDSVNGQTGVVVLDTDDIAEGDNLYFTTARANTAIADYDGDIDTSGTITANAFVGDGSGLTNVGGGNVDSVNGQTGVVVLDTDDVAEGDNLYFTTERANSAIDARVVGSENIDVTSGVISLTNALGNVNSVTAEASTNLTLNNDNKLVVTQNFKGRAVAPSGNIEHDGYAFFSAGAGPGSFVTYTGNANIENFRIPSGNTTIGSNVITDVFAVEARPGGPAANIADIAVNSLWERGRSSYPFPAGTVVTSVDAANNTIFMSADAVATQDLGFSALAVTYSVGPALVDSSTGQAIRLFSEYDNTGSGSKTTLIGNQVAFTGIYGYPQSGFDISDFDIITAGVADDYSLADTSTFMLGRNKLSAPKTVLQAPAGLIVGNNADLTNRAENDAIPSFGINLLWDGTDTSYPGPPITQFLLKNYTDNNAQQGINRSVAGPRMLFTASEGNATEPFAQTYPRENLELGRLMWWAPTAGLAGTSTFAPPAWINGITGQDNTTTNSGLGMYFANSPNVNDFSRGLYFANTKGNTMIAGGAFADGKITFAKMIQNQGAIADRGNSAFLYNSTMDGTLFADLGHANTAGGSGSKFSVTNGGSAGAGVVGDMAVSLNRIDNGGNLTDSINGWGNGQTIIDIGMIGLSPNNTSINANSITLISSISSTLLPNSTAVTIADAAGDPANASVNSNVFYTYFQVNTGEVFYTLYTDAALTTEALYTNAWSGGFAGGPGFIPLDTTWNGNFTYPVLSGVTAKTWDIVLEEQSEELKFKANAVTVATITDAGNIVASNFIGNVDGTTGVFTGNVDAVTVNANLVGSTATLSGNADVTGNINLGTNATINYDAVYGCFHNLSNVTAATADTVFEFQWPNVHINTNRVTVESNSQITFGQEGAYVFSLEMQAENTDNALRTAFIWLAKNGTDIEETCVRVSLFKQDSQVIMKQWIVDGIDANDFIEVRFAVDNTSGVQLTSIPAQESPYARPAIPSAVITVTPVGV